MKNMKLKFLAFSALLLAAACAFAEKSQVKKRPNLLFIMTDQQRYDAIAAAGKYGFLKTPNLDKLAETGAYFTRAYTPCAVSGPARSCILTGLNVEHTGVLTNELTSEDPVKNNFTTKKTFDQILADNGYYSEYHGKWHAPISWTKCYEGFGYEIPNKNRPFHYKTHHLIKFAQFIGPAAKAYQKKDGDLFDKTMFQAYYTPDPIDRRVVYGTSPDGELTQEELKRRIHTQPDNHGLLRVPAEKSITAFQALETIAALDRAKKSGKPFNITCSFFYPHSPMLPTEPYHGMYDPDRMPIPSSISDPMVDSPYVRENAREVLKEYANPNLVKYMMSNYFALVSEVDDWIGKILNKLDEIGERENTLIVFVSDHGEMLGAHGMREKNVFFEESARVPMILNFPGKIKPVKIGECVSLIDLFPTILDYMGVKYDARDGESLIPYIDKTKTKENTVVSEWLYHKGRPMSHMIVDGDWKLMVSYDLTCKLPAVLFNLKDDPNETKNLIGASNPDRAKYIQKANELKLKLLQRLKSQNSKFVDNISQLSFN